MALDLATAVVSITGNDAPLRGAISGAKAATDRGVAAMQARLRKLGATFARVGRRMTAMVTLPILAGAALAIKAYMGQEDAENSLAAALQNRGAAVAKLMPQFKAFAALMQKQTIFGDELVISQMAYAANLGVTTDELEGATKAAIGLAAKYRIDLQTAMMLVGRAALGQTQMLTRYGIVLEESLSPQEKFNALLVIGAKSFKLAQAETKTASGRLKQAKNEFGDAAEKLGKSLIPAMIVLTDKVTALSRWFSGLSKSGKKTVVVLGAIAAAAGPVLLVLGAIMKLRMAAHVAQLVVSMNALAAAQTAVAGSGVAAKASLLGIVGTKAGILAAAYAVGYLGKQLIDWRTRALKKERETISGRGVAEYNLARQQRTGLAAGESSLAPRPGSPAGLSKRDSKNLETIAKSTRQTAKEGGRLP